MDKLGYLLSRQKELHEVLKTKRPDYYKNVDLNNILVLYCDAMIDECSEIKKHLHWKPWKNRQTTLNIAELKEETIDVLHFLLDMCNMLGMDEHEIVQVYDAKHKINVGRQEGKFDKAYMAKE